jgi:hypothetical protein
MKLVILLVMISSIDGLFNGCPMDGCDSTLSGFVDIQVDGFDKDVQWRRTDLLSNISRGCVSNALDSPICTVDIGFASINITNGDLLWSIALEPEERTEATELPVITYQGYSIIANSTRCTLIDPQGAIVGSFNYNPTLISPLAGPSLIEAGQIVVADSTSVSFEYINPSSKILGKTEYMNIEPTSFEKSLKHLM